LAIAAQNARQADLANITCIPGNWTEPVATQRFDMIVSNPPYVRNDDEALQSLRHEPLSALAAGDDGLDDIRILARDCARILAVDGWLMLEHGAEQQVDVAAILMAEGWVDVACHNDLAGKPRVTVARQNGT
jgi:release factor glutamine methyltransferase